MCMHVVLLGCNIMLAVRMLWSWVAAPPLDLTIMASTDLIWQGQLEQPSVSDKSVEKNPPRCKINMRWNRSEARCNQWAAHH